MKKILLYGYGGSYNHGSEAIIKCTVEYLKNIYPDYPIYLSTHFKEQDVEFNLPVDVYLERDTSYVTLDKNSSVKGKYDAKIYASTIAAIDEDTICYSIGGDNYCYGTWHRWKTIHDVAIKRGAKDILWGCSIEPGLLEDRSTGLAEHLASFERIVARESITYNALIKAGLNNVEFKPDAAFALEKKATELPKNYKEKETVAINLSPLIIRKEVKSGDVLNSYMKVIDHIIQHTDLNILLIPHVRCAVDDDLIPLKVLYEKYSETDRVALPDKHLSAAECKYLIAGCKYGIFARTHASIAAYSSGVPCVVVGYSVKARGIAKDLGMEQFVVPVEELENNDRLLKVFLKLSSESDAFDQRS